MRGLILGYLLGSKTARDWCVKKICQASCLIDKELKKTNLWKLLTEKRDDDISETD